MSSRTSKVIRKFFRSNSERKKKRKKQKSGNSWRPNLSEIMNDEKLFSAMLEFCENKYNDENLCFLVAVRKLNEKIRKLEIEKQKFEQRKLYSEKKLTFRNVILHSDTSAFCHSDLKIDQQPEETDQDFFEICKTNTSTEEKDFQNLGNMKISKKIYKKARSKTTIQSLNLNSFSKFSGSTVQQKNILKDDSLSFSETENKKNLGSHQKSSSFFLSSRHLSFSEKNQKKCRKNLEKLEKKAEKKRQKFEAKTKIIDLMIYQVFFAYIFEQATFQINLSHGQFRKLKTVFLDFDQDTKEFTLFEKSQFFAAAQTEIEKLISSNLLGTFYSSQLFQKKIKNHKKYINKKKTSLTCLEKGTKKIKKTKKARSFKENSDLSKEFINKRVEKITRTDNEFLIFMPQAKKSEFLENYSFLYHSDDFTTFRDHFPSDLLRTPIPNKYNANNHPTNILGNLNINFPTLELNSSIFSGEKENEFKNHYQGPKNDTVFLTKINNVEPKLERSIDTLKISLVSDCSDKKTDSSEKNSSKTDSTDYKKNFMSLKNTKNNICEKEDQFCGNHFHTFLGLDPNRKNSDNLFAYELETDKHSQEFDHFQNYTAHLEESSSDVYPKKFQKRSARLFSNTSNSSIASSDKFTPFSTTSNISFSDHNFSPLAFNFANNFIRQKR